MRRFLLSVPDDGSCQDAIQLLGKALHRHSQADVLVKAGADTPEGTPECLVVALGCLADNAFIRGQYLRLRTLVDRWYPGSDGYVLQTVQLAGDERPRAVVVGGSSSEGTRAAALALAGRIAERPSAPIEWHLEVKLGQEHLPLPKDRIDVLGGAVSPVLTPESQRPNTPYVTGYEGGPVCDHLLRLGMYGPHADNAHFSRSSQLGLRYLYTGRQADGERYRDVLLDEVAQGIVPRLYHYKSVRMFQLWELLSPSPIFTAQDRRTVQRALLDYLLHGTAVAAIGKIRAQTTAEGLFDRHTACDALNLWLGSDYALRLTGDSQWRHHREVADAYFRSQAGTDVPYTGLTEGYCSYLEVYLEWLIAACPEQIPADSHVRRWADRIVGLCTNRGTLVVGAQTDEARYCYNLMRRLAFFLNDDRYLFVSNLRERYVTQGGDDRVQQFTAGQAYAGDVAVGPDLPGVGLTVFPLNERHRRWRAPGIPAGAGFDRLVGRAGWSLDDDYFVVVGVRGGAKTLPNVGSLATYERFGATYIASPTLALRAEENSPWGYSVVTVVTDELSEGFHSGAHLVGTWTSFGLELVTLKCVVAGHHVWYRTIAWQPNAMLLVCDRVVFERSCRYTVSVNWRCARDMVVDGDTAWCDCRTERGKHSRFTVRTSAPALLYDPRPQSELDEDVDEARPCLPTLHAMRDGETTSDRAVEVITLMYAVDGALEDVYRLDTGMAEGVVLECPSRRALLLTGLADETAPVIRPVPSQQAHSQHTSRRGTDARLGAPAVLPWEVALASAPECTALNGANSLLAVGCRDGSCRIIDQDSRVQRHCRCASAVTALTFLGEDVIVGTRDGEVRRIGSDGRSLWQYQCRFRPERDFWHWWFLQTPYVGGLAAGVEAATGECYVAAGTGSCALNVLDADTGTLVSDVISPYGLADVIKPRVDPDTGELQFYAGHSRLTCSSSVRAWSPQADSAPPRCYDAVCGAEDRRAPGWDMCGVVDFDTVPAAMAGSGSDCVMVLRHGTFNQLAAYDRRTTRPLWMQPIGGVPCALCVGCSGASARCGIAVAERFGWLFRFSMDGELLSAERVASRLEGVALRLSGQLLLWGDGTLIAGGTRGRFSRVSMAGVALGHCRVGVHDGLLVYCDGSLRLVQAGE